MNPSSQFIAEFEERKQQHLKHALDSAHQAQGLGGLDQVHLIHEALPELDLEEVQLSSPSLGKTRATPFFVCGMTAGHADAPALNAVLAEACAERGWAFGVGSQRRELEAGAAPDRWEEMRGRAPGLVAYANIGIAQLIELVRDGRIARLRAMLDKLGAHALAVHANALQEALQPEGTPRFKGALAALREISAELGAPVVLKETGCGFSAATLARLRETGLAAVDVSGLGGTHWGRIEGARAAPGSPQAEAAPAFAQWGEPTVWSVAAAAEVFHGTEVEVWASGGVRTGLDAAKLIALGAAQVGFAKPALEAALAGPEKLRHWMAARELELRIALFCTGCASPSVLHRKEGVMSECRR